MWKIVVLPLSIRKRRSVCLTMACMLLVFICERPAYASGNSYYVDPNKGSDANVGTVTEPWRTLGGTINRLHSGDTLYLRGGTYWESNVQVNVQGSRDRSITVRSYPGERAVIDGGFTEFRAVPNEDWEVVDAAKCLYRSKRTFADAEYAYGYFGPDNGGFRLISYEKYSNIETDNQDYAEGSTYLGPGVFWNRSDGRVTVRLQRSKYEPRLGYDIPRNTDPRSTSLFIFPGGSVLCFGERAAYLRIEGVDFKFRNNALEYRSGSHHITLADSNVLGGRVHILVRDGAHDLAFEKVSIIDGVPPWMARSDVKRPKGNAPGHRMQGAGFALVGEVYNVEIAECIVRNAFDAIDATHNPHGLHIHHCEFSGIRDDCLQLGSAGYDIEVNDNRMIRVSCGLSWNGSGHPPAGKIGTKYVHHNVIDASHLSLYLRSDPKDLLTSGKRARGPAQDGIASHRAIGMHTRNRITGPDPWKIYQNTFVVGRDYTANRGVDCSYYIEPYDPKNPHEVYNNIFLQLADHWIAQDARVADGSQIFDGNIYFRKVLHGKKPLFRNFRNDGEKESFSSLKELLRSEYFMASRSYYRPGWESSGIQADPLLDENYRPAANGPASNGAVPLPTGFPGGDGKKYRGALPPLD